MFKKVTINSKTIFENLLLDKDVSIIEIKDVRFNDAKINLLPKARSLYLDSVEISDEIPFESYENIAFLSIENQCVDLEIISKLFPNLGELILKRCTIKNHNTTIFENLEAIELCEMNLEKLPEFVFNTPKLEYLNLGKNDKKISVPSELINLKNLRKLSLYRLEISHFDYLFEKITLTDENDFFLLLLEECTIHEFPKQLTNIHENFIIYHSDCKFQNYSKSEIENFHTRFPPNAD